jgi:hypothetical protein
MTTGKTLREKRRVARRKREKRWRDCGSKVRYATIEEAAVPGRLRPGWGVRTCPTCAGFHITSTPRGKFIVLVCIPRHIPGAERTGYRKARAVLEGCFE